MGLIYSSCFTCWGATDVFALLPHLRLHQLCRLLSLAAHKESLIINYSFTLTPSVFLTLKDDPVLNNELVTADFESILDMGERQIRGGIY